MSKKKFERVVYDVPWIVKQLEDRLDSLRYQQSRYALDNDTANVEYVQHQIVELDALLYKVNTLC